MQAIQAPMRTEYMCKRWGAVGEHANVKELARITGATAPGSHANRGFFLSRVEKVSQDQPS